MSKNLGCVKRSKAPWKKALPVVDSKSCYRERNSILANPNDHVCRQMRDKVSSRDQALAAQLELLNGKHRDDEEQVNQLIQDTLHLLKDPTRRKVLNLAEERAAAAQNLLDFTHASWPDTESEVQNKAEHLKTIKQVEKQLLKTYFSDINQRQLQQKKQKIAPIHFSPEEASCFLDKGYLDYGSYVEPFTFTEAQKYYAFLQGLMPSRSTRQRSLPTGVRQYLVK